jgi:hypothetical protein
MAPWTKLEVRIFKRTQIAIVCFDVLFAPLFDEIVVFNKRQGIGVIVGPEAKLLAIVSLQAAAADLCSVVNLFADTETISLCYAFDGGRKLEARSRR